ncbi:hypothetical protein Zmor_021880 [Zophobas morio]|uniref:Tyr recombinase domain-containing protein n=1 Tax=Zophobas morio TaxID=2755281 RepID=A0AA38I728_9CUCU|nr:hypothetical protein Zmor_021880 [Zophobas morio]
MPSVVAEFLNLPNPKEYTGHCFRRSSASLAADSDVDLISLKRLGGWKSSSVAESYIEESVERKKKICRQLLGEKQNEPSTNTLLVTTEATSTTSRDISLIPSSSSGVMKDRENVKVESRPTDPITILPLLTLGKDSELELLHSGAVTVVNDISRVVDRIASDGSTSDLLHIYQRTQGSSRGLPRLIWDYSLGQSACKQHTSPEWRLSGVVGLSDKLTVTSGWLLREIYLHKLFQVIRLWTQLAKKDKQRKQRAKLVEESKLRNDLEAIDDPTASLQKMADGQSRIIKLTGK